MLNCCIARKCLSKKNTQEALKQQHIPLQHPWSRSSHDNVNDSSDEEFFEALEDQDGSDEESEAWTATTEITIKREGALKRCGDLKLIKSGEALYIPITQVLLKSTS